MLQAETPIMNGIFILFITLIFQYFQMKILQSVKRTFDQQIHPYKQNFQSFSSNTK